MGLQHIQPVPFSLSLYLCFCSRPVSSPMCISGLSRTKVSALHRAVRRPKSQLWLWPLHLACRREVLDGAPTSPFPTSLLSHYRTSAEVEASASVSALEVKLLFYRRALWRASQLWIQIRSPHSERACTCTMERANDWGLLCKVL